MERSENIYAEMDHIFETHGLVRIFDAISLSLQDRIRHCHSGKEAEETLKFALKHVELIKNRINKE